MTAPQTFITGLVIDAPVRMLCAVRHLAREKPSHLARVPKERGSSQVPEPKLNCL